ncbi:hypothetical protein ABW19_dt0202745 [Dactylella cylindrospora]|nr:hypothetical protein ABW19_dt0202745 [Dactylella cylindrospora]
MPLKKKTYGGGRLSTGLREEHNDVFKSRALEKKTEKKQNDVETELDNEPKPKEAPKKDSFPKVVTKKAVPVAKPPSSKSGRRDVFDLESSGDEQPAEVKKRPLKKAKDRKDGGQNVEARNKTGKTAANIFDMSSTDETDSKIAKPKHSKKSIATQAGKTANVEPKNAGIKRKPKDTNSEDREERSKDKRSKKQKTSAEPDNRYIINPSESKPTAVKRKSKEVSTDPDGSTEEEIVQEKVRKKRLDNTTKAPNLPDPRKPKMQTQKSSKEVTRKAGKEIRKEARKDAERGKGIKASAAKKVEQESSTTTESPAFKVPVPDVYDHALDLSYDKITSPVLLSKGPKKVPTLAKEPSAVAEMPTGLTELIDSQLAEIGEQKASKKPKLKKMEKKQEAIIAEEMDLFDVEDGSNMLAESTGAKEAELQAQIQAAMWGAERGVRTTRSKFKNEAAAKRSYGGGQRTIRQPANREEELEDRKLEMNRVLEKQEIERSRPPNNNGKNSKNGKAAKGKRGKKANDDEEDLDDDDKGPKVASRHALLESGKHQVLLDELDALAEEIGGTNIVMKRNSIMDLAQIMSRNTEKGREYVQKFRLNGYDQQILKNLQLEDDEISRIGFGWTMFIYLNQELYSGHAVELFFSNGGFEMLKKMLSSDQDLQALTRNSVLKSTVLINQISGKARSSLLECRYIGPHTPGSFSQRYVALMILNTVLRHVRKDEGRKMILESFDPKQFVEILSPITAYIAAPEGGKLTDFALALSILAQYNQSASVHQPLSELLEEGHHVVLSNLLPTVLKWNIFDGMEDFDRAKDFQASVLKLCIDRTNEDPAMSTSLADYRNGLTLITESCVKQFQQIGRVADQDEDLDKDIENLVLTGILLSNIVEFSETARTFLRTQKSANKPLIDCLMKVFVERHEKLELAESVEETHLNVAFGYLTVALSYACRDLSIRSQVKERLDGNLDPLIIAVTTFKIQNKRLEDAEQASSQDLEDLMGEPKSSPTTISYTKRLEDILEELRGYGTH